MMQGQRELSKLHKLRMQIRRQIERIDSRIIRLERGLEHGNGNGGLDGTTTVGRKVRRVRGT